MPNYRPLTKLREGYVFTGVCDSVHRGGVRGCSRGGHAWLLWGGAWLLGGVRGCSGGACMVAPGGMHGCSLGGGHVWLLWGVRGCSGGHVWLLWGVCMVALGGMHGCCQGGRAWLLLGGVHGCSGGGGMWDTTRYGDTINERAVRILLECILVTRHVL